jgi:hypothetical protein
VNCLATFTSPGQLGFAAKQALVYYQPARLTQGYILNHRLPLIARIKLFSSGFLA